VVVLDTHAWLWWAAAPSRLSGAARKTIEGADLVGVATISVWELAMLQARGRIRLARPIGEWVGRALAGPHVREVPLSSEIALAAGLLDTASFVGDPADRIVYATARTLNAPLVTRDQRLRGFDVAGTVW
jgi:PIN domain nuclease of toxin-antitoxin system